MDKTKSPAELKARIPQPYLAEKLIKTMQETGNQKLDRKILILHLATSQCGFSR